MGMNSDAWKDEAVPSPPVASVVLLLSFIYDYIYKYIYIL